MWNPRTKTYDFPSITVSTNPETLDNVARLEDAYTYNSVAGYHVGTTDMAGKGGILYDFIYNGSIKSINRVSKDGFIQVNLAFVKRDENNIYLSSDITHGANTVLRYNETVPNIGLLQNSQMGEFSTIDQVYVDDVIISGDKTSQVGYADPNKGENPLFYEEPIQDALTIPDITDKQMKYFLKYFIGVSTVFTADVSILYYDMNLKFIGKSSMTSITTTENTHTVEILAEGFDLPEKVKYVFLGINSGIEIPISFKYASIQVETCLEELNQDPTLLKSNTDHLFIKLLTDGSGGGGGTVIPNDLSIETIELNGTATSTPIITLKPTSGKTMSITSDDDLIISAGGGMIDVSGAVITNCKTPVLENDVATKSYVDGKSSGGSGSLPLTGGTIKGPLNIDPDNNGRNNFTFTSDVGDDGTYLNINNSSSSGHGGCIFFNSGRDGSGNPIPTARIQNTSGGNQIQLLISSGSTLLNLKESETSLNTSLNLQNNKLINLLAPTLPTDATNKKYVDDAISASGGGSGLMPPLPAMYFDSITALGGGQFWLVGNPSVVCEFEIDYQSFASKSSAMTLNIPCLNMMSSDSTPMPSFTLVFQYRYGGGAYSPNKVFYSYQSNNAPLFSSSISYTRKFDAISASTTGFQVRITAFVSSSAKSTVLMTNYNTATASLLFTQIQ